MINKLLHNKATILSVYMLFSAIVIIFIFYEITQSRNELLLTVENESENLIQSLNQGLLNNYSANSVIEDNIIDKLNSVSAFVEHINEHHIPEPENILKNQNVDFILIADFQENKVMSSESLSDNDLHIFRQYFEYIQEENFLWYELGIENLDNDNSYYLMARITKNNELIVVGIKSQKLLEIRKNTGIGTLINDFSKNPDIEYIILQDTIGIFAASKKIDDIKSVSEDEFLNNIWITGDLNSRIIEKDDKKLFETVILLKFPNNAKFLTRLSLSLEKIRNIQQRSFRRTLIFGFIILASSGIVLLLFKTREKVGVLSKEKDAFETYINVLLENINDAVIGINKSNKIVVFNKTSEDLFKVEKEQFDISILDLISSNDLKEISTKDSEGNVKIILAGRSTISIGEDVLSLYFIKDITEIKKSEEIIRRQEKLSAMGQLAAGVAHEIRNPLNAINIIVQRFKYEFDVSEDKEEFNKLNDTIRKEVVRVNGIIEQFLDFTRPKKLNIKQISLDDLSDHIYNLLKSDALERNIKLEFDFDKKIIIEADKDKLKQVFINLIRNAIQAIDFNGTIKMHYSQMNEYVFINIEDNGPGISPDNLKKIFNPYFSTKKSGTGIGLSIVHQIITEHNGSINVNSELNEGTVFTIKLPVNL